MDDEPPARGASAAVGVAVGAAEAFSCSKRRRCCAASFASSSARAAAAASSASFTIESSCIAER